PVALGQQTRPCGMVEDRRVAAALNELDPPWIVEREEPQHDGAWGGSAPTIGRARSALVARGSAERRFHARCADIGSSSNAGSGSSAARTANSIGPRSDARYASTPSRPARISP